jgi:hypothetical protein
MGLDAWFIGLLDGASSLLMYANILAGRRRHLGRGPTPNGISQKSYFFKLKFLYFKIVFIY